MQSVVTDKHGNTARSPGIMINVHNVPVNTEIGRPLDGATVSGVVPVDGAADGQTDIISVKYVLNSVNSVSRTDGDDRSVGNNHEGDSIHLARSDRDENSQGGRGEGDQGEPGRVVATGTLSLNGWISLWNTATVPNGSYTLRTVATEQGGGMAMSQPINITVQNNCSDHGHRRGNDRDGDRGRQGCETSDGGHHGNDGGHLDSSRTSNDR
jgi:hypothetical protein